MRQLIYVFLLAALGWNSLAQAEVLEINPQRKVFYRYSEAKKGQPTVVLMNGLIYAISNWDGYYETLVDQGVGVLQLAYSTQPESLQALNGESPEYNELEWTILGFKQKGIETQDFVDETMAVIDELGIKRFSVLGLSYGSIVATSFAVQKKHRIDNLILVAPAVMTSGRYNPYGAARHNYYSGLKSIGNIGADFYYDLEIYQTLSLLVTPNKYSFSDVAFNDFFDGVFQMARSSKWFDLKKYAENDLPPTYLFIASREEGSLLEDQKKFWFLMNDNPAKRGLVVFEGSYHAIPGVAPEASALETARILKGENQDEETLVVVEPDPSLPGTLSNSLLDSSAWSSQ